MANTTDPKTTDRTKAVTAEDITDVMIEHLGSSPAYCRDYADGLSEDERRLFAPLPDSHVALTSTMKRVADSRKSDSTRSKKPRVPKGEHP